MTDLTALREKILQILEKSDDDEAYIQAADLIRASSLESLPVFRLAILRSFTIEPLADVLLVKFFLEGFRLELFLSEFNQYEQEILDEASRLYRFKPELIFFAVRLEEMAAPWIFTQYGVSPEDDEKAINEVKGTIEELLEQLTKRSNSNVLLSNFMVPVIGSRGIYDTQTLSGQISVIRVLNSWLLEIKSDFHRVTLFDVDLLSSRIGKDKFLDPLQKYRMSNPYRLDVYAAYGEYFMHHVRALLGRQRKCLVLDLDDTLWGGVLGEEGIKGVQLSDTYPGNCFKDFQGAILQLSRRGILLAINSKNNLEEALQMLRTHPDMVLKEEHFSAVRINWNDKAENLREIAAELNIGLDSMVYMDDSPAECERIRQAFPEVQVVQLPPQKYLYRSTLENLGSFEQLTLTEEDRSRAAMYREQASRKKLASQLKTREDFYASLEMRGTLHRNNRSQIARIAQMTQKTNQFNLTTRRCTEAEISRWMNTGAYVYGFQVEDKFGDNGIIAAAVVIPSPDRSEWVINNFLMSCRVVMRTIEDTLLAEIAEDVRSSGGARLIGRYFRTDRNGMVKEFYSTHGFMVRYIDSNRTEYLLDLKIADGPKPSPWIELTREAEIRR